MATLKNKAEDIKNTINFIIFMLFNMRYKNV